MTTTTIYGTWTTRVEPYSATFATSVYEALGDYADECDIDAIAADYRNAINEALPEGVALVGDEFIGPAYDADCDFDSYPTDEYGRLDIKTIVESVDLWAIVAKHDTSA
jgi:hypothetical protein